MRLPSLKNISMPLLIILMLISPVSFSMADSVLPAEEFPFVYLFHLYYDNGQLFADRDFEFKYDLIAEPFEQSAVGTSTPYKGEMISVSNSVLGSFQFDPTVAKGKISVKGPYFSNAGKVDFYNDVGQLLLTLSVADSSVCNENGVCNSDTGEDYNNCSADCEQPVAPPVDGGGLPRGILYVIAGAITAVVVWVIWIIIKRRKSGIMPPPAMPSSGGQPDSIPTVLPKVTPLPPPQPPVPSQAPPAIK